MILQSSSKELLEKKAQLLIEEDKCNDEIKKEQLQKMIGELNIKIYQNAVNSIKKDKENVKNVAVKQKSYTARELRQIVDKKFKIYQQLALDLRKIYPELVKKKRECTEINKMISNKDSKSVKRALEV